MFEREPNIDVVFRNGLKDLEVLPPSDVWKNIPPVRGTRNPYPALIGIAAGITVLLTFSFLASRFSSPDIASSDGTVIAANSGQNNIIIQPETRVSGVNTSSAENYSQTLAESSESRSVEAVIETASVPALPSVAQQKEQDQSENKEGITVLNSWGYGVNTASGATGFKIDEFTLAANDNKETEATRFMIGASLYPSMGFASSEQDSRMAELLHNEKEAASYSTGLTFGYKLSNRFTIQSGIGLSSVGQSVTGIDVFAGLSDYYSAKGNYLYSVETTSGYVMSSNADIYLTDSKNRVGTFIPDGMADPSKYSLDLIDNNLRQVFRYIEVPLLVRYKVIDRGVDLNLSGGMAYGLLVQNMAYAMDGSNIVPIGHTEGVNLHTLSSQIGLGMEYSITRVLSFNIEPMFRYYLTPFNDLSGSISRPYTFGLYSGLFIRF